MNYEQEIISLKKKNEALEVRIKKLEALISGSGNLSVSKVSFVLDRSGNYSELWNKAVDIDNRLKTLEKQNIVVA
jgi:chaperonin cofactor prefoldin